MIIGIHQPNFMPWPGYFHKINRCDAFVFLDDAQYTKNSFINRNRIKTPQGPQWLTVPVLSQDKFGQPINSVETVNTVDWRKKHLGAISANYRKSKFFNWAYPELASIYQEEEWRNLSRLNIRLIKWAMGKLDIHTPLSFSSEMHLEGKSTELLVNIVRSLKGDVYLSGKGGANYQDEALFAQSGIKLEYTSFVPPQYEQPWGEFVPGLSVLDLFLNHGPDSKSLLG